MNRRLLFVLVLIAVAVGVWAETRRPAPTLTRIPSPELSATAVEQGQKVYARYGCVMCHGADGTGGFANVNSETDGEVPGVIYVAEGYTEEELHRLIREGTPPVGKADPDGPQPPYTMPGWGDRMSEEDVSALVSYLMSLYPEGAADVW